MWERNEKKKKGKRTFCLPRVARECYFIAARSDIYALMYVCVRLMNVPILKIYANICVREFRLYITIVFLPRYVIVYCLFDRLVSCSINFTIGLPGCFFKRATYRNKQAAVNNELSSFRSKDTRRWESVARSVNVFPKASGEATLRQRIFRISIELKSHALSSDATWYNLAQFQPSCIAICIAFYFRRLQRDARRRFRILKWRSLKEGRERKKLRMDYPVELAMSWWKFDHWKGTRNLVLLRMDRTNFIWNFF